MFDNIVLNSHKILYREDNCFIDISNFSSIKGKLRQDRLGIKYVAEGKESYTSSENSFHVNSNEYLVTNRHYDYNVESQNQTKGFCIDIDNYIVSEVLTYYFRPKLSVNSDQFELFFDSSEFFENKFNATNTHLGIFIKDIISKYRDYELKDANFSKELIYSICEQLIRDYAIIFHQLGKINELKPRTRNDIYRKILKARNIIEENYKHNIAIDQLSKECCMSEFHFYKMFKQAVGISPYQYLINQRMNKAKQEIKTDSKSLQEIAIEVGFSDIQAFSKLFKKNFGIPPKVYHNQFFHK